MAHESSLPGRRWQEESRGSVGGGERGTEGAGRRLEDASERIGERIAGRNEMVEFIVPRDTELVPPGRNK